MLRRHIFINSDLHLKGDVIFHVTNQNEPIKKAIDKMPMAFYTKNAQVGLSASASLYGPPASR